MARQLRSRDEFVALRARPDTLRVQVGGDPRLLFRLHATTLEVVALINRRDLDRRVKVCRRHRRTDVPLSGAGGNPVARFASP